MTEQESTGNEYDKMQQLQGLSATQAAEFSIFTKREKWVIVLIAAMAGFFSPLASNLYLPAIPEIGRAFHKSTELINLTITAYIVLQGIAPLFWGTFADQSGRRLALLGTMVTLAGSSIGLALVPTDAYWALMLLRCLQAAGSASTYAIGTGIIADIARPSERGGVMSLFFMGPMVGPCLGPIIGGALAQNLGWRSIFWFLLIASAAAIVVIMLFLPETLRALVGDGSIPPPKIHTALIPIIGRSRWKAQSNIERPPRRQFQNPLTLFLLPDVTILLLLNSITNGVLYAVTASLTTVFRQTYPYLDETKVGLCYLAIGGGMFIASMTNGRLLDREYRRVQEEELQKRTSTEKGSALNPKDIPNNEDFPIERARLRILLFYLVLFVCCVFPYGWVLQKSVSIAVPLILQVFIGYFMFAVMNCTQTLAVDLTPGRSSSVTGCYNFARCSFAAVTVSVVQLIINAIGVGWTFTILGGISCLCVPMALLELRMGPVWRARREEANKRKTQV